MKKFTFKSFFFFLLIFTLGSSLNVSAHWNSRGPVGGSVSCFHKVDTIVYVGTFTGGVFRSVNKKAETWRAIPVGLKTGKINALTSIGKYILAGTDKGIFVSKNIGAAWSEQNSGLNNLKVNSLASFEDKILAGTDAGVYLSSDSGKTWVAATAGIGTNKVIELVTGSGKFYAASETGVYVSDLNSISWNLANTGLGENPVITSLFYADEKLYAGVNGKIFLTSVSQLSWSQISTGLNGSEINNIFSSGESLYTATNSGVYKSTIGQINWVNVNSGIKTDTVTSLIIFNSRIYAGTKNEGIFLSDLVTTNWVAHNTGFTNLKTTSLVVKDKIVITSTDKGVFISKDEGTNFVRSNKGLKDSLNVTDIAFSGNLTIAATRNQGIFVSTDTGKTWSQQNMHLNGNEVKKVIIGPGNTIYLITANNKIYYSSTGHLHWEPLMTGLPFGASLADLETDGINLYLASSTHGVYKLENFSWKEINDGLNGLQVKDLVVSNEKLFICTNDGVFSSSSANVFWNESSNGLTNPAEINSLAIYNNYVLAGYTGGVQVSENLGVVWQPFETLLNLPDYAVINDISFSTNRIFVRTPDNSVYSNSLGELPVGFKDPTSQLFKELIIFPNPGNGNFSILNNDAPKIEQIVVYSISGQIVEVITPQNNSFQYLEKGVHFAKFKGESLNRTYKIVVE